MFMAYNVIIIKGETPYECHTIVSETLKQYSNIEKFI